VVETDNSFGILDATLNLIATFSEGLGTWRKADDGDWDYKAVFVKVHRTTTLPTTIPIPPNQFDNATERVFLWFTVNGDSIDGEFELEPSAAFPIGLAGTFVGSRVEVDTD